MISGRESSTSKDLVIGQKKYLSDRIIFSEDAVKISIFKQ